jgi:hypothetical protein
VVTRGQEDEEVLHNGARLGFWKMEGDSGGGGGGKTMLIYLMPLNYTLKNG